MGVRTDRLARPTQPKLALKIARRLALQHQVEHPQGKRALVMLPAKYNKKLWLLRGGFLIVDVCDAAAAGHAGVTGTVAAVLYEAHVKQLRRMGGGVW